MVAFAVAFAKLIASLFASAVFAGIFAQFPKVILEFGFLEISVLAGISFRIAKFLVRGFEISPTISPAILRTFLGMGWGGCTSFRAISSCSGMEFSNRVGVFLLLGCTLSCTLGTPITLIGVLGIALKFVLTFFRITSVKIASSLLELVIFGILGVVSAIVAIVFGVSGMTVIFSRFLGISVGLRVGFCTEFAIVVSSPVLGSFIFGEFTLASRTKLLLRLRVIGVGTFLAAIFVAVGKIAKR